MFIPYWREDVQVCEPYDYEVVDLSLGLWPDGPDSLLEKSSSKKKGEKSHRVVRMQLRL